jgi:hypothetical protein
MSKKEKIEKRGQKPSNPIVEFKGLGKGVFGEPVAYQKKLREKC